MATAAKPGIQSVLQASGTKTEATSDKYLEFFKKDPDGKNKIKAEPGNASNMVKNFYDISTDFYEYGWGESFHFCTFKKGESFEDAIIRHEEYLATKLDLGPQDTVMDFGCGVGGPARTMAKFSNAKIIGINYNDYQIERAKALTEKAKLSHLCTYQKGDFTKLDDIESESADKVYSVEATCHASSKAEVYGEMYRLLKPGGLCGVYEWVLKDHKFDPENPELVKIAEDIPIGNGLPLLDTDVFVLKTMKEVGFEIVEHEDMAVKSEVPWETPLVPGWMNFKATPLGRAATHAMLFCLEKLGISPKGSTKVHSLLCQGADALIKGAKSEIFTPMFFMLLRKPENPKK